MSLPIPAELAQQLNLLSREQLAFLAGFAWAKSSEAAATAAAPAAERRITVLSASQTGNARRVAETLTQQLHAAGLDALSVSSADYKSRKLAEEDIVLLVASTQGEGEPPEEALPLYQFLFGKKAPDLSRVHFAVLALGDSSYPQFCRTGQDFDAQLAKLGATRLHDIGVCDLDFQAAAAAWTHDIVAQLSTLCAAPVAPAAPAAVPADTPAAAPAYSREHPYTAHLSQRQKITARASEKDVEHIEINLGDSGIRYRPGDALGVYPENDPALVADILDIAGLGGEEKITRADGSTSDIRHALQHDLNLTQNTPHFVRRYAELSAAEELARLAQDNDALNAYIAQTPIIGVLRDYPSELSAQALHNLFRAQTPRLYSIASAQDEVGDEVHLSVGVLRFDYHGKTCTGAASAYLGERLPEGGSLRVFVEPNPSFRLPENGDVPIIMIAAGTGIAPFRAFMQQREADGATGGNWLIYGNRTFTADFLYQAEWLQYRKNGLLTRADLAWSRQEAQKVYVRHKLLAAAAEVWAWLQQGAHIYVCGDAARMAHDVDEALLEIAAAQGKLSRDDAQEYLLSLREDKRYQRDIY